MKRISGIRIWLITCMMMVKSIHVVAQNSTIDSLLFQFETCQFDTAKIDLALAIFENYRDIDMTMSRKYCEIAAVIAQDKGYETYLIDVFLKKATYYLDLSELDSADLLLRNTLEKSRTLGYNPGIYHSHRLLASLMYFKNNYKDELHYYSKALSIAKEHNVSVNFGDLTNNIGSTYYRLGDAVNAKKYYLEAIRIYLKNNEPRRIAGTYSNLGLAYERLENIDSALFYFTESLSLHTQSNNQRGIATCHYDLASLHTSKENYIEALAHAQESYTLAQKLSDIDIQPYLLEILARANFQLGNTDLAIDYYTKSLSLGEALTDKLFLIDAYQSVAKIYVELQDYKKAYESISKSKLYQDSVEIAENYKSFHEINMKYEAEEGKKELQELQTYTQNKEELLGERTILLYAVLILSGLTLFFAFFNYKSFEKLKRFNKSLKMKNAEIATKNDELEELLAIKDRLFSITTHDIRSPLISIKSLLELLQDGSISYPDAIKLGGRLNTKVNNTLNILENFLMWIKNQMGRLSYSPVAIDFNKVAEEVLEHFESNIRHKKLRVSNQLGDITSVYTDVNIIEIVVRNLISNAIKFSDTDGEIIIEKKVGTDVTEISITDYGIGMSISQMNDLFSLNGSVSSTHNGSEKGVGLGLILCIEFIEINQGRLWVESQENYGSKFTFSIPSYT